MKGRRKRRRRKGKDGQKDRMETQAGSVFMAVAGSGLVEKNGRKRRNGRLK